MKILQLCNKVPYPEKDGGVIAINVFTRELLRRGHSVKMLAMNTTKHYINPASIPEEFKKSTGLETVNVNNSVKVTGALKALLKGQSYNISRFHTKAYGQKLSDILSRETFDLIQLEGLYLTPYISLIKQYSKVPVLLKTHNVEWKIWERLAKKEPGFLKKKYLQILAKQLKAYEQEAINKCDGIMAFTKTDVSLYKEMGCKVPIAHIPFGIDISRYIPQKSNEPKTLLFIGSLDWLPNMQGLEWFLNKVWPQLYKVLPDVELHIAGRNMPDILRKNPAPGVIIHGEVDNALAFMQQYNIMIAPLFAGSGVRVKIIEGMALAKCIVATTIGIEGIECTKGKDALVADSAGEFYKTLKHCFEDSGFANEIEKNARKFAEEYHNIEKITENLIAFYNERILANK